ncbi:hypothetical protein pb186bvf_007098 [Paramecium bursaria]
MDSPPVGVGQFKFQLLVKQEVQANKVMGRRGSLQTAHFERRLQKELVVPPRSNFDIPRSANPRRESSPYKRKSVKKQKSVIYQIDVSSDSSSYSDTSSDLIEPQPVIMLKSTDKSRESPKVVPKNQAVLNLRTLLKKDNSEKNNFPILQQQKSQEKKKIVFLKGLQQNQNMGKDELVEEYQQFGKINVKIQSKDFLTFMRWEHEIEELKRKKRVFDEQKEKIRQMVQGNGVEKIEIEEKRKITQERANKYNKSWIVGVSMAKTLIRRYQMRRTTQIQQPPRKTILIPPPDTKHKTLIVPSPKSWVKLNDSLRSEDARSMGSANDI